MTKTLTATLLAAALALPLGAQSVRKDAATPSLKDVYKNDFRIGTAIAPRVFENLDTTDVRIVRTQFNAITP